MSLGKASPEHARILSKLLYDSGPTSLNALFQQSAQHSALGYLEHALQQAEGQYGYNNQWIMHQNSKPIAMASAWTVNMPETFVEGTIRSIYDYYSSQEVLAIFAASKVLSSYLAAPPENGLCLGHLSVHPDQRGQGFARQLINHFVDLAKQKNKEYLILDVTESNHHAITCYQAMGFTLTHTYHAPAHAKKLGLETHLRFSLKV